MKKTGIYIAAVAAAVITMAGGTNYALRNQYEREIHELKEQLAKAQTYTPLERDTIRDSISVATSSAIEADLKAIRRQLLIDERLIRDLGLRLGQTDAVQTTAVETRDTVKAGPGQASGIYCHDDQWSHLEFRLPDSTFYYNIRDSLATIVYHDYKHRFLWWRWGVKGYKVKVVNFNPHSTIRYSTYVKPGK